MRRVSWSIPEEDTLPPQQMQHCNAGMTDESGPQQSFSNHQKQLSFSSHPSPPLAPSALTSDSLDHVLEIGKQLEAALEILGSDSATMADKRVDGEKRLQSIPSLEPNKFTTPSPSFFSIGLLVGCPE